jgi:hypothetical protein
MRIDGFPACAGKPEICENKDQLWNFNACPNYFPMVYKVRGRPEKKIS